MRNLVQPISYAILLAFILLLASCGHEAEDLNVPPIR